MENRVLIRSGMIGYLLVSYRRNHYLKLVKNALGKKYHEFGFQDKIFLMKSLIVTVIVPRLPPAIDGLGDYGLSLAKQMRQDFGVQTEFIVGDPNWSGESLIDGFNVHKISSRTAQGLIDLLPKNQDSRQTVLVHYVGYGYAKRGSPIWLIGGLAKWRNDFDNRNLIIMFHELFAFGPIWTSQFWTSPLQRYLAAKLGRISDHCLTSKTIYSEIMCRLTRGKHSAMPVLPVFSNVGEPEKPIPLIERERRIVIFGSKVPRSRVYKNSRAELLKLCRKFNIVEIFDIGPPLEFEIEPINGISVKILGIKTSEEISSILSSSMIGFINYPTEYLAKSGIFAAYCSHGILPIATWYEGQQVDAVRMNVQYWISNIDYPLSVNLYEAQIIADNAYHWYQEHRLSVHAQTFFKFF